MRIVDLIAQTLVAHGIRYAFGMPGGEVVTLLDGLERAGIQFTLARHETPASMMAAGASAVTGLPAVLLTTLGPGLANAVNGIADAQQEQVPLIVLSGQVEHAVRGRYTHQIIDHAALLRPLVKGSFEVAAEGAAETVARAIALATRAPAGPVHIDLSPAVAAQAAPMGDRAIMPPLRQFPAARADDLSVRAAAERLADAKKPVVIAGFEAARQALALTSFVEAFGLPLITTYKAKGIVPETHPLCLGGAGLSTKADTVLLGLLKQADCVLTLGYDPIEMRAGWLDAFGAATEVIDITLCPADHGMHRIDRQIIGALPAVLPALTEALAALPRRQPYWLGKEVEDAREALARSFLPPEGWGPHAVFAGLSNALSPDATITVDSGAHRILFSQMWKASRPLSVLQSAGFCTMGAALPLAIGIAQTGAPGPIVAVMGDGGLEMVLGELATLRDTGKQVILLILQDASLALIALKQAQAGLRPAGIALGESDFPAVARAYGGKGFRADSPVTLQAALAEALAYDGFTLIACPVDAEAYRGAF